MDLLEAICDGSSITQMAKLHQHTCRCLDGQLSDLLQQHMETPPDCLHSSFQFTDIFDYNFVTSHLLKWLVTVTVLKML